MDGSQDRSTTADQTLGRYRLERRLGQGGMAEVFFATHTGAAGFERPVCLKRILPNLASDPDFRDMFVREARIAGRLCHASIVQVFDCIEDGDALAIVMELVDGMDLRAFIRAHRKRGEKLSEGIVAYIAGQLLSALHFAHDQQVVHRDVSPHNVLLSKRGEVKLADFGVAKAFLSHATMTGEIKGKLAYMSPEQAKCEPIDGRTDLYSAGLIFYELLQGERFFPILPQGELIVAVANAKRPRLQNVSPELSELVETLLEPNRDNRYPNAAEALKHLPSWELAGPAGAIELGKVLQRISDPTSRTVFDPTGGNAQVAAATPSPRVDGPSKGAQEERPRAQPNLPPPGSARPAPKPLPQVPIKAGGTHETELLRGETQVLEGQGTPQPSRPVIPAGPNAPTTTREADLDRAIALAPTAEVETPAQEEQRDTVQNEDAYGPTFEAQAPPSLETASPPSRRMSTGKLIAVMGVCALIIGGATGLGMRLFAAAAQAPQSTPAAPAPAEPTGEGATVPQAEAPPATAPQPGAQIAQETGSEPSAVTESPQGEEPPAGTSGPRCRGKACGPRAGPSGEPQASTEPAASPGEGITIQPVDPPQAEDPPDPQPRPRPRPSPRPREQEPTLTTYNPFDS